MTYIIVLSRDARDHLDAIYDYIADASAPDVAKRFTSRIVDHIAKLADFPHRGSPRDDLAVGLRTIVYKRRVTIAYAIDGDTVLVIGIFYGGRDFETLLREE